MKNPLLNKKGESLVEVVSSCAIFGILIVMATTVLMSSMDITKAAMRINKADGQIAVFHDSDGDTATPPTATAATPTTAIFQINFAGVGVLEANLEITEITGAAGGAKLRVAKTSSLKPM